MVDIPYFELNNGVCMPSIGLGCFIVGDDVGTRGEAMVRKALDIGYRHFDTAYFYRNEAYVGKAIRESSIPRSEIFVTTKLTNKYHDRVREGFDGSLAELGLEYIDLYLMHWPQASDEHGNPRAPDESPTFIETWREMEKLLDTGKVHAIGVSNFSIPNLERLLRHARIVPAVNQVELHPCLPQFALQEYCSERGIRVAAYSPLGQPTTGPDSVPFFSDETLSEIADTHGASVGQVLLSWSVQRGVPVIPKSENEGRMQQNLTLLRLSEDEIALINDFHKKPRMHRSMLSKYFEDGKVFGWTLEQLGWNTDEQGYVKE